MHVFAKGDQRTVKRLLTLRRQAQADKAPRVVLRIQGILMSLDGCSTGQIAQRLKVHRSGVPVWIKQWNDHGEEGLREGQRSGRPAELNSQQRERLRDLLDSGPVAYGLETGIWTSPLVAGVIREEFACAYHPGHVRKLLRQVPTRGERNTQKIFGAVRLDNAEFIYLHQESYFQWETYLAFVEQVVVPAFYRRGHRIYLIQDNASYHKKQEACDWFAQHRRYVEVFQWPPYWPELNATERIWNYTRKHATHNRFFEKPEHLCRVLFRTFDKVRRHPEEIEGLLRPFC